MTWIFSRAMMEHCERLRCSQGPEAEFSEVSFSGGEPFAQLSVMPTPHKFWRNDKTMDALSLSRFGLTSAVLTEGRGAELLTLYLEDFRAKTLAQLDEAQELKATNLDCGSKWHELSVRFDRDLCSWKTHRCLWDEVLPWSSVILPRWGMTVNGSVYQHPTLERPISATASGLWATPSATDGKRGGTITDNMTGIGLSQKINTPSHWPTPTVCGNHNRKGASKTSGDGLATAVKNWPTPVASMSKGSSQNALTRKSGADRSNDRLDHAVMASDGGQLNPDWVEWLMGWPIGWTDLKPLGMDKYREWQQQHSLNF